MPFIVSGPSGSAEAVLTEAYKITHKTLQIDHAPGPTDGADPGHCDESHSPVHRPTGLGAGEEQQSQPGSQMAHPADGVASNASGRTARRSTIASDIWRNSPTSA